MLPVLRTIVTEVGDPYKHIRTIQMGKSILTINSHVLESCRC